MRPGRWLGWLKWPVTLAVLTGLLAGAYFVHNTMKAERSGEEGEAIQTTRRARNGVVTLSLDEVADQGIEDEPAQAIDWAEPVIIYGRLVPNPRTSSVVQAPFAGTLQTDSGHPWPGVGTNVKAGQVLGQLKLRVGPQERLDLQVKRNEARLQVQGAEKIVAIQQERLDRLEKFSRDGQIVSQRELDDARVLLNQAKTNLAVAQAGEKLWKGALDAIAGQGQSAVSIYNHPVKAPADGEVVETTARPGMAVEAGAILARIVDFHHPLARMDLPSAVLTTGPPATIELTMLPTSPGQATLPSPRLSAALLGPAAEVDPTSQLTRYWYESTLGVESGTTLPAAWRPGRFVSALVRVPGTPKRPAFAVPITAVLTHQGRHLVYVKESAGKYQRRGVRLLGQEGDRAILATGVRAGEAVVTRQAQVLLSEEFRSTAEED